MTRWITVCALALVGPGLCACSSDDDDDSSNQGHPATCQGLCSVSIGCPNDPELDCLETCEDSTAECPAETAAFISCAVALPETDLECDAVGETNMKDTVCIAERAAVAACRRAPDTGGDASAGAAGASSPTGTGGSGASGTTSAAGLGTTGGSGASGAEAALPDPPGSGLPTDAALSSLTRAQATQLCEQANAYRRGPMCLLVGWAVGPGAGGPMAECERQNETCLAGTADSDCWPAFDDYADCSTTVGEVDQCYADTFPRFISTLGGTTCATVNPNADAEPLATTRMPSCQVIDTKCPDLNL